MEHGSLRGFLLGDCPTCAYDNWYSHVTEGIALAGVNNYGPSTFDPQTNGFGHFSPIPNGDGGDSILTAWEAVFNAAVDGNWFVVDSALAVHDSAWNYELVELQDTSVQKIYYLIRERLDSSFVDTNVASNPNDDVIGGFRNSWGLYIFDPNAIRQNVIVQVVHPEDDFLAVPIAIEFFQKTDARALMMASAGREVCWDSLHPPYNNTKSISDPSRNGRHPYHQGHQVLFDRLDQGPTHQLVTVQFHSYDANAHNGLADVQITANCNDDKPNPPLRDVVNHLDVVNLLPYYPIDRLSADTSLRQKVDKYISLYSNPRYYYYHTGGNPLPIISTIELCGYSQNQQALYCHLAHEGHPAHDEESDPENFVHIELDEYADGLWTPNNPQWDRWLLTAAPATWETFPLVLEYYAPFVAALDSALWYSHFISDSLPPAAVQLGQVTLLGDSQVYLRWSPPAADPAFDTYLLYFDTAAVTASSPFVTRTSATYLSPLHSYQTQSSVLKNLAPPLGQYYFAVGSRDLWGNSQPPCSSLQVTDGMIADLTARMLGTDTLELNWSRQNGDSLYSVFRQLHQDSAFSLLLNSDTNQVRIPVNDSLLLGYFRVYRVLKP